MNPYRAGPVCLPARTFQLENCWKDFDEIRCGHYSILDYIGISTSTMRACEVGAAVIPPNLGP
jgi:hypothetical protein